MHGSGTDSLYEENLKIVSEKLGVKRGAEMSFEEADGSKGNPNFGRSKEYRINCQCCVVANELRRRGYNVEAMPNYDKDRSFPVILSYNTERAWRDADGNTPKLRTSGGIKSDSSTWRSTYKRRAEMLRELEEMTADEGRYHISWTWNRKRTGHIITFERLKGGGKIIYDPQTGKTIADFAAYAKDISTSGIRVLRVDNLLVDTDIISGAVKASGTKSPQSATAATHGRNGSLTIGGIQASKAKLTAEEVTVKAENGIGYIITDTARLDKANSNKQERAKFDKEFSMCKVLSQNGHNVKILEEVSGESSCDILLDGKRAELKSMSGIANIVRRAEKAVKKQGAEIVVFEFAEKKAEVFEKIKSVAAKGIHGKFYFKGEGIIMDF